MGHTKEGAPSFLKTLDRPRALGFNPKQAN